MQWQKTHRFPLVVVEKKERKPQKKNLNNITQKNDTQKLWNLKHNLATPQHKFKLSSFLSS